MPGIYWGVLIILIIILIVASIMTFRWRSELIACQSNESSFCPTYVCPPVGGVQGQYAGRVDANGQLQCSNGESTCFDPRK